MIVSAARLHGRAASRRGLYMAGDQVDNARMWLRLHPLYRPRHVAKDEAGMDGCPTHVIRFDLRSRLRAAFNSSTNSAARAISGIDQIVKFVARRPA
jgi:hypothetical protein